MQRVPRKLTLSHYDNRIVLAKKAIFHSIFSFLLIVLDAIFTYGGVGTLLCALDFKLPAHRSGER
jgi:hypothetical protein